MQLIFNPADLSRLARAWNNEPLILVPTMGALHAGHLALVDLARRHAGVAGKVVVSIFVNPLQFGPAEDLSRYPRPLQADLDLCRARGVDAVFHPETAGMYPPDEEGGGGGTVTVAESLLSTRLCGQSRPGHFRGVCTVVAKLFNLARPTAAVFGLKDYQQLAIIRRMVRDLNFPVEIIAGETVREPDGLALSSRNVFLTPQERAQAPALRRALLAAAQTVTTGETNPATIRQSIIDRLTTDAPSGRIDYVEVADPHSLQPLQVIPATGAVLALAVFFGRTRLIDNILAPLPSPHQ